MTRLLHKKEVVASSQMSLEEFSQVHAVRKKVLMRLNKMNATDTIFKGDVIVLGRGLF
jgi:predicted RNA polymerase sigma factor